MTARLRKVTVSGFRSLRDVSLELTPVTVLIGPNGAGKSNLLWALEMVRMLAFESLQLFVGERGGATFLMHYGPRVTPVIHLVLEFASPSGENAYEARLAYGADESLIFTDERAGFRKTSTDEWRWIALGAGHRESMLRDAAAKDVTAKTVRWLLRRINFYHFHDTSRRSALRTRSFADTAADYLRSDGSNLPAFLDAMRDSTDSSTSAAWQRITGLVRRAAPFVTEIVPTPDPKGIALQWKDDRGEILGPAHLSDGTLRMIALITALGQPESLLPMLSCIDEPELGLHPSALEILCGLISSVTTHHQVIVSTQSPAILDHFEPDSIVVAERSDAATALKRLDATKLSSWLEDYSLSELYDKNVLGGRP
jgi:predicted ATPase